MIPANAVYRRPPDSHYGQHAIFRGTTIVLVGTVSSFQIFKAIAHGRADRNGPRWTCVP